jgi:hypothetical protein
MMTTFPGRREKPAATASALVLIRLASAAAIWQPSS